MKLTKQDIDKVRHIEGFPIGSDEDIITLSNPPYYTACPNPFIEEFIKQNGKPYDEETDEYKREPFVADVTEGKNDPVYMAHSYHTKVPHKAIMKYILHYTNPGDIVFDGFCGTGMTGVAAQKCADPDSEYKFQVEKGMSKVNWGKRNAIVCDISPMATFISSNYNVDVDIYKFSVVANEIFREIKKKYEWMYETVCHNYDNNNPAKRAKINYVVWSNVYICKNCSHEFVYWDVVVDKKTGNENKILYCPNCGVELSLSNIERSIEISHDTVINKTVELSKQVPVMIKYTLEGKKGQLKKIPDEYDFKLLKKISNESFNGWFPTDEFPKGDKTGEPIRIGIERVHQIYTRRNLIILAEIYNKISTIDDQRIKNHLMYLFSSIYTRSHKMNRYMPRHNRHVGPLDKTLYFSYFQAEINVLDLFESKLKAIVRASSVKNSSMISTQSSTDLRNIPTNSIDYVFIDPPFGANIMYSELNFPMESWLKVHTNNDKEAIMNKTQNKKLAEYQDLMDKAFNEIFRVLKPNRWITIEFHNSQNSVWNAIQESIIKAGFIVADVRTLDKTKGTINQMAYSSAVKLDLVISAYKTKDSFKQKFLEHAGSEETAWDFIREHLEKLPIVVNKGNKIEIVREREGFLLFDRMVAYHIMSGIAVPIDASDFYKGLDERFIKRDSMYFLHDQVNEYDNVRVVSEFEQIQICLFVTDEKNAIAWLYQQLEKPQTYGEIQPKFVQELRTVKYEKMPELAELLQENFLQDNEGKWYIPDPTKSGDIIKLREKRLLKEFEEYLTGKGKLKVFRTEAVRVGFAKLWKDKDYQNIVKVANRLPESVIQEDDKLLMYYDISLSRVE